MIFNIQNHNTLRPAITATPLHDCDQLIFRIMIRAQLRHVALSIRLPRMKIHAKEL